MTKFSAESQIYLTFLFATISTYFLDVVNSLFNYTFCRYEYDTNNEFVLSFVKGDPTISCDDSNFTNFQQSVILCNIILWVVIIPFGSLGIIV